MQRRHFLGEWDLNDPDALKKDMPARVSNDDPRCGPASLQKFQGEDLNSRARLKYQKEQLREWSRMQQEDRQRVERQQQAADRLYDAKQNELDQRSVELQRAEEECRRAINESLKNYNDALVDFFRKEKLVDRLSLFLVSRNSRTSCFEETSRRI